MQIICCLLLLTGAYPLWQSWQANRRTSLLASIYWAMLSWVAWVAAAVIAMGSSAPATRASWYLALCLTACAGVAVLGARRPGVGPWNFVVLALLGLELLPLAEALVKGGSLRLDGVRAMPVAAALVVGILNYVPTRLAPAVILLLVGCASFTAWIVSPGSDSDVPFYLRAGCLALAIVPWVAFASLRQRTTASEFDRLWLDFRDRYGFVWAQRLRDQFNRSAFHSGWPVFLSWEGLRLLVPASPPLPDLQTAALTTLQALMRRFGPEDETRPIA